MKLSYRHWLGFAVAIIAMLFVARSWMNNDGVTVPGALVDAMNDLQESKAQGNRPARELVLTWQAELFDDPSSPVAGNPSGDMTVVEFFDYRCPYCKQVHPTIQTLLREDGNIRFVYKEWPILGPSSVYAAKSALAARSQQKYVAFHAALMDTRGALDEAAVQRAALSAGMDMDRLRQDLEGHADEFDDILRRNHELAKNLQLTGTPAFIIGDAIIPGIIDMATMKNVIASARQRVPRDIGRPESASPR